MEKPVNRTSLVIPGLLGPQQQYPLLEAEERPRVKNLVTVLSRASCVENQDDDWFSQVFELLLSEPDSKGGPIPFAAISAHHDQLENVPAHCLRIDPVFLRIDMDSAIMLAAEELQLSVEEATALGESINQHLGEEGMRIHIAHPHRWYLFLDEPAGISTTALHRVMRQDVHGYLPEGQEQQYWRSLLNEIQMLLHTHPVNRQRTEQGQAPVNSVWFWGEGELPQRPETDIDAVYTDNPLLEILTGFFAIPCYPLEQYVESQQNGKLLLVMTELEDFVYHQDIFAWIEALNRLDATIFKSIRSAFKMKQLQHCDIYPCGQKHYEISIQQSSKWWQRSRSLEHFINT